MRPRTPAEAHAREGPGEGREDEGGPPHPAEAGDRSPDTDGGGAVPPWAGMDDDELRQRMRRAHQEDCAPYFRNRFADDPDDPDQRGSRAQRECGRKPTWQQDVDFYEDAEDGDLYALGLRTCGSVWACPVCARRKCIQKGEALQAALERYRGEGGSVYMANLTLRHHRGQALEFLMDAIQNAWSYLRSSSDQSRELAANFEELRDRFGIRGYLQTSEVTHGGNGWHPHKHVLLFTGRDWSDEDLEAVEDWLYERWTERLTRIRDARDEDGDLRYVPRSRDPSRLDLPLEAPSRERGVVLVGGEAAGRYVAKLGLGREAARMDAKEGRGRNRTPFEILRDYTFFGRPEDLRLWREYVEAMHGRAHWHFSQGMKEQLGGEQLEADLEDPDREDDARAFTVGRNLWNDLERDMGPEIQEAIRDVWHGGGWEDLVQLFRAWCDPLPGVRLEIDSRERELFDASTLTGRR